jgi:aryl-alcohol dehydrogenase-like predicted oxidoreductase
LTIKWAVVAVLVHHRVDYHFIRHQALVDDPVGKFDKTDFRSTLPKFSPENMKANHALVEVVIAFAERKKVPPAQIALGWLLAQKPWIVPIPGTTKLERLDENLGTVEVEFTDKELQEIDKASSQVKLKGDRYSPLHQQLVGR